MDIIAQIRQGDIRATARLLRELDEGEPQAREVLKQLYPYTGRAHVVGITGSPGVGKSTLTDQMIHYLRRQGFTVGVVAVDPTSPFSGGAILGDRIRMQRHATDEGVFIRSLATRGHFGGLTASARAVINVLDAMGKDFILVETVGVGQDEVDIVHAAHTTIVVTVPGLGDDIQAIKAGILEIADVFAVNKADHEGADRTAMALEMMLDLNTGPQQVVHHGQLMVVAAPPPEDAGKGKGWRPPICKTVAVRNRGIEELAQAIEAHRAYLQESGLWQRREEERAARTLETMLQEELLRRVVAAHPPEEIASLVRQIAQRALDPYTAVQRLLGEVPPG